MLALLIFVVLCIWLLGVFFSSVGTAIGFAILGIIVLVKVLVKVIGYYIKEKNERNLAEARANREELRRIISNLDNCQSIYNNSNNIMAAQYAMDEILEIIDHLITYREEDLKRAGTGKDELLKQKQFILDHYDERLN